MAEVASGSSTVNEELMIRSQLQEVAASDLPDILMAQAESTIRGIFDRYSFFTYRRDTKDNETQLAPSALILKRLKPDLYGDLNVPEGVLKRFYTKRIFMILTHILSGTNPR